MNTSIRPVGIDNIAQPRQIPIKPVEEDEPNFDFDKDLKEHIEKHENEDITETDPEHTEQEQPLYYPQMPHPMMPPMPIPSSQNSGLFSDEKWVYLTIFIGFVVGILLGRTMSGPVVIRHP